MCVRSVAQSCPTLWIWTVACQIPLSMGFSRQEYWSGLLFLSQRDLPDPGEGWKILHFQSQGSTQIPIAILAPLSGWPG